MRVRIFIILLILSANWAIADEIDDLITNLPSVWKFGIHTIMPLSKTATPEQLTDEFFKYNWDHKDLAINHTILKSREVDVPRAFFPHATVDPTTVVLMQTSQGKKVLFFKYEDDFGQGGWTSEFHSYPEDISGPIKNGYGDGIRNWLDFPARRDNQLHLALVEILEITNSQYSYGVSPGGRVSDDDGKTWYNMLCSWSGNATFRLVESPGVKMPPTNTAAFVRSGYVHAKGEPLADRMVKPGRRLLAFFAETKGVWSLEGGFYDPVDYLLMPDYGDRLQKNFTVPLSDPQTLAERKKIQDEAKKRARQQYLKNKLN